MSARSSKRPRITRSVAAAAAAPAPAEEPLPATQPYAHDDAASSVSDSESDRECTCLTDDFYCAYGEDLEKTFDYAWTRCKGTEHNCTCNNLANCTSARYQKGHTCRAPVGHHDCTCWWVGPDECEARGDHKCICDKDTECDNTAACQADTHSCTCKWDASVRADPEAPSVCREHGRVWAPAVGAAAEPESA